MHATKMNLFRGQITSALHQTIMSLRSILSEELGMYFPPQK